MPKRKKTEQEDFKTTSDRQMQVYKADAMIQKGRHKLSLQEQKCVLFAMSKIKPDDNVFQEYTFDIKEFYNAAGLQTNSYTKLKSMLTELKQKTWWIETAPGEESTVSWFNKVRSNKNKGTVTVRFDDDMMPYLLDVTSSPDSFYTHYSLKYILPMGSQYGPRLYEILKSYQKNNWQWFFDIDKLKKQLDCENYKNFNDFKRFALQPAVDDINTYSDINIAWDVEKKGVKIIRVIFFMADKNKEALYKAEDNINKALEGETFEERNKRIVEEITERMLDPNDVRTKFRRENFNNDKDDDNGQQSLF